MLLARSSPRWMVADLAIAMVGAVSVPVYPSLVADQVVAILEALPMSPKLLDAILRRALLERLLDCGLHRKQYDKIIDELKDVIREMMDADHQMQHQEMFLAEQAVTRLKAAGKRKPDVMFDFKAVQTLARDYKGANTAAARQIEKKFGVTAEEIEGAGAFI